MLLDQFVVSFAQAVAKVSDAAWIVSLCLTGVLLARGGQSRWPFAGSHDFVFPPLPSLDDVPSSYFVSGYIVFFSLYVTPVYRFPKQQFSSVMSQYLDFGILKTRSPHCVWHRAGRQTGQLDLKERSGRKRTPGLQLSTQCCCHGWKDSEGKHCSVRYWNWTSHLLTSDIFDTCKPCVLFYAYIMYNEMVLVLGPCRIRKTLLSLLNKKERSAAGHLT